MRHKYLFAAVAAAFAFGGRSAHAVEQVEVLALSGRVLRGAVDTRTDDARLWVRQEDGGVVLAGSIAWGDVAQATLEGSPVAADELRRRAVDAASSGPRWFAEVEVPPRPIPLPLGTAPPSRHAQDRKPHLRSMEIVDACLVNLDRDVEPDGLRISVTAIGDDGLPMVVRGNLTAQLVGEQHPASEAGGTFGELDRWTQPVAAADFVDGAATYELRFRRTAPEWQFELMPVAVLEVRLGAHGEGNYAASAPVVLRQFNPLRDHLQLNYGTRFTQRELHGRRPASAPVRHGGPWQYWTW